MDTKILSRSYLETLSSADLLSLADDYGIDVPDDLNRRFLIGELLEITEESQQEKPADIVKNDTDEPFAAVFSETYNETQINLVLRNPVWAFVYWDIKEADKERFAEEWLEQLSLRVSFFADETTNVPDESFDIQITPTDRAQYILLKAGKKFVRIDLVARFGEKGEDTLAISRRVPLPSGSDLLSTALPGREVVFSPLQELSSVREVLRAHYEHHRQSFTA